MDSEACTNGSWLNARSSTWLVANKSEKPAEAFELRYFYHVTPLSCS
jgi:hypothetical protein